jgi:hypothetical protein
MPVLKGYKIHQEQIANVARTLKESTQRLRPEPLTIAHAGKRKPATKSGTTGSAVHSPRNIVWGTGAVKGSVTNVQTDTPPGTEETGQITPAIQCFRCGDGFPVTDFLYTKKTGLCIPCWEAKVV